MTDTRVEPGTTEGAGELAEELRTTLAITEDTHLVYSRGKVATIAAALDELDAVKRERDEWRLKSEKLYIVATESQKEADRCLDTCDRLDAQRDAAEQRAAGLESLVRSLLPRCVGSVEHDRAVAALEKEQTP